ncbi:hypothetical protein A3H16_03320 [Candidatus Kaiserbacteria bacterium RIFCSPLOWO2_12_FULL_53_8]|uniref:Uncharacterized protein n=2 Tax=Candidatus Kaiseribacteriota TaxID=1752734 RepID=A0A1F6CTS4_9BACT|nr:MAG: hypothetical protein A2851_00675 [Candidatus Kaiserbacteria bacterium RIFCSPHIGHO2_01_FULL_53_29]OGG91196.1 MAG: hypothetical protein A3H16_03320 [Candidatus Kaiserbacteria bacterium RIFCSPLOWO2_12_FULL_53_8]
MDHTEHDEWLENQKARRQEVENRRALKKAAKQGKPLPKPKTDEPEKRGLDTGGGGHPELGVY